MRNPPSVKLLILKLGAPERARFSFSEKVFTGEIIRIELSVIMIAANIIIKKYSDRFVINITSKIV